MNDQLLKQIMQLLQDGNIRDVDAIYRDAVERDPSDYLTISKIHSLMLNELFRQIREEPENPSPYFELGVIYSKDRDYRSAERFLQLSIEKNPDNANACFELAIVFVGLGHWTEATMLLEKFIQSSPRNPRAYFVISLLYGRVGRWDDAVVNIRHYVEKNPEDEVAYAFFIQSLIYSNHKDEAENILREEIGISKNDPIPQYEDFNKKPTDLQLLWDAVSRKKPIYRHISSKDLWDNLAQRFAGDSTTDAPPPDVNKKK